MEELIYALGSDLVDVVGQNRRRPDPQTFLGSGKLEEVRERVLSQGANVVVVNAELKPGQIFNLYDFFNDPQARRAHARETAATAAGPADHPETAEGAPWSVEAARANRERSDHVEVYDRVRVILEIFHERAASQEARLQVELAKLQYEVPLVKEYVHLAKKGERPGFLAGGAYEIDQYHDMITRRIAKIKGDLARISRERDVRRKHRRRSGFHLVSLAGYTNAGKSSLLRLLSTGAPDGASPGRGGKEATRAAKRRAQEITVENRYFSTLGTKTRRAASGKREILVTDTVGFIEDLPPWLVEAFHSTLEEIALADAILLVVDASDPDEEVVRRLRSSLRVLWRFDGQWIGRGRAPTGGDRGPRTGETRPRPSGDTSLAPLIVVLNKTDLLAAGELEEKVRLLEREDLLPEGPGWVAVSARTREGLPDLYERIYEALEDYDDYEVAIPQGPAGESFLAWLHDNADVLDLTRGNEVHVHFEAPSRLRAPLEERLNAMHATRLREVFRSEGEEKVEEEKAGNEGPAEG